MAALSYKQTGYAVLEVLKKYSDENHRLRQLQIIGLVEKETGLVHARKSIRKDLNELVEAGYPVRFDKGWYYEHEFCPAELNLIVDSLYTMSGITAGQRDELIRKISRLGGSWYAGNECNQQLRPVNPQFLYTLDILHEAVREGKKVSFFYGNYGTDKRLHYRCRDDGTARDYLINPYSILTFNGRYYLICNVDKYEQIAHFRIERIMDIRLLKEDRKPISMVTGCENGIDVQKYITDHPYMYQGQVREQRMRIQNEGINDILDWFGMGVRFENEAEGCTDVIISTDEISLDFWKRRYGQFVITVKPSAKEK